MRSSTIYAIASILIALNGFALGGMFIYSAIVYTWTYVANNLLIIPNLLVFLFGVLVIWFFSCMAMGAWDDARKSYEEERKYYEKNK